MGVRVQLGIKLNPESTASYSSPFIRDGVWGGNRRCLHMLQWCVWSSAREKEQPRVDLSMFAAGCTTSFPLSYPI